MTQRDHKYKPPVSACPDCGKFRYATRKLARKAARSHKGGTGRHVYRCGGFWHFTTTTPATRTARNREAS